GLAIVYGIVNDHGGEVLVDSRQGHGTTFTIELPIARQNASSKAAPTRRHPLSYLSASRSPLNIPQSGAIKTRRRERILVVEDEPTVANLIGDVLGEEGHLVDTVLDSREGLERIDRNKYDLVICDLRMAH